MIEIYSKDNCPQCEVAISLLEANDILFRVKKLGVDFEIEDVIDQFPTARSFPIVVFEDGRAGNLNSLRTFLE